MIFREMKEYQYKMIGNNVNEYGEKAVEAASPLSTIKMFIRVSNKQKDNLDNIKYTDIKMVGLTKDYIDDRYIIVDGDKEYKAVYVVETPRYNMAYLEVIK